MRPTHIAFSIMVIIGAGLFTSLVPFLDIDLAIPNMWIAPISDQTHLPIEKEENQTIEAVERRTEGTLVSQNPLHPEIGVWIKDGKLMVSNSNPGAYELGEYQIPRQWDALFAEFQTRNIICYESQNGTYLTDRWGSSPRWLGAEKTCDDSPYRN